jgi:CheY-like chemotaxis protein
MMSLDSRILVAEDDSTTRMLLVEVLRDAGYSDVVEAGDGEEACHLLYYPDNVTLFITDINMPHVNGIEVATRAKTQHPDVNIIFISALPEKSIHLPFSYSFLQKPFKVSQLFTAVGDTRPTIAA